MPAPVRDGHVTQEYGVPGNYAAGYHTGRDWAGGTTRDILATRAGTVTRVAYDGDYGNRVEILTGDIEHSYSHMASTAVAVGQDVAQGQYLGEMGDTGNSRGIHCHYEEREYPYGYNDSRYPEFDISGQDEEEEDSDMGAPIAFFSHGGATWEADLLAGTYHLITSGQDLNDRKWALSQAGIKWVDFPEYENLDAFGVRIGA